MSTFILSMRVDQIPPFDYNSKDLGHLGIVAMVCSSSSLWSCLLACLPVFIQALSGNTSDKIHFRVIVKEYGKSLQEMCGKDKIWVWDSAGYTVWWCKTAMGSGILRESVREGDENAEQEDRKGE